MATQPRQSKHRTKMRQRRGLWIVSCSCYWSEETVSRLSALMALRRHQETHGGSDFQGGGRLAQS